MIFRAKNDAMIDMRREDWGFSCSKWNNIHSGGTDILYVVRDGDLEYREIAPAPKTSKEIGEWLTKALDAIALERAPRLPDQE